LLRYEAASGEAPCSKHSGESSPFSSAINTQCFAVKYVEVQNLSKSHALSISSDSKLHISSDRSDRSIFDSEFHATSTGRGVSDLSRALFSIRKVAGERHLHSHRIHVCMLYMVAFTINISPMLAFIPYMDPRG
jgi:hypothetical protein